MSGLKVLNLIGQEIQFLLPSFSLLSNLRTLLLVSWSFVSKDIAKIGELKGLRVLTLWVNIKQLPQEIGQLTQLQLLDLRGCDFLYMIPPNVLSSSRKLMELYLPRNIHWHIDDPNNQQRNASLAELNHMPWLTTLEVSICDVRMLPKDLVLERLHRYKITIGRVNGFSNVPVYLDPNFNFIRRYLPPTQKELKLNLGTSIHFWDNFKRLFDSVKTLYLGDLKGAKNVVPEINVEGMQQLKNLTLSSGNEIQTTVESSGLNHANAIDIFPNLEKLRISRMTNLSRLWDGPLAGKSFYELKDMSVHNCPKMKSLFSAFTITEEIVSGNEKALNFPELRLLSLEVLPELISFCDEDETYSSPQSTNFQLIWGTIVLALT